MRDGEVKNQTSDAVPATGRFFLIEERTPDFSYEMFGNAIAEGRTGLVMTRDFPADVQRRYDIQNTQIYWLTHLVGENHFNPTALGLLLSKITNFLDHNKRSAILLDGIEYLISQNNYERILHFLHQVRDIIIIHMGTLIMPLDTRVLEEKEIALLERNLEVITPPETPSGKKLTFELEDGLLKLLRHTER